MLSLKIILSWSYCKVSYNHIIVWLIVIIFRVQKVNIICICTCREKDVLTEVEKVEENTDLAAQLEAEREKV